MKIEPSRLELFSLSLKQLQDLLKDPSIFESSTGYIYDGEPLAPPISIAFSSACEKLKTDPEHSIYYSIWMIALKESKTVIGSIALKNIPNAKGEVEIGYGIHLPHQGKGYMNEALKSFTKHVKSLPNVKEIIAQTKKTNISSQKVLENNHFTIYKSTILYYWWIQSK